MKKIKCYFAVFMVTIISFSQVILARDPVIKIKDIEEDLFVTGKVANLKEIKKHAILLYIHTDKWYIHPYAGQGEGLIWAAIEKNGNWKIETKKRKFKANKIAALIVTKKIAENAPDYLNDINEINSKAIVIYNKEDMKRKRWFGKL